MPSRHPSTKVQPKTKGPAKSGSAVEPGQPGSYGTDRVRVTDGKPETGSDTAAGLLGSPANNKVDTGAAPSVGSSPSRQR